MTPCQRTLILSALVFSATAVHAAEKSARTPVARSTSEDGALLRREASDKPWQPVAEKEILQSGDLILCDDLGSSLLSSNGAVRLSFRGDFNGNSPFPILETAVVLHSATDVDLDVTLDRGRIDLTNMKEREPARVRVHIQDKAAEIVLTGPGARVAIEIYGRWQRGVPFTKTVKPGEGPTLAIVVLAIKGEVELKGKVKDLTLKAPPGPALIHGDTLQDFDPQPVYVDKLPEWAADGVETERGRRLKEHLGRFRKLLLAKGVSAAVEELAQSEDEKVRGCAVVLMGALDDLPRLGKALTEAKHPDVWDVAVLTMRHWLGRAPGQDQKLYHGLIEKRGYSPREAETVLQLLHSFGDEETSRPELYQMLINYLNNDKLPIRGLAYWHLVRLAPAGKKIAYDPASSKEERARAIQEWRQLIPSGKLPPEDK